MKFLNKFNPFKSASMKPDDTEFKSGLADYIDDVFLSVFEESFLSDQAFWFNNKSYRIKEEDSSIEEDEHYKIMIRSNQGINLDKFNTYFIKFSDRIKKLIGLDCSYVKPDSVNVTINRKDNTKYKFEAAVKIKIYIR
jgi:hypothetical protein